MIAVRPGRDGTPAHWRLSNRTSTAADLLASAPLSGTGRPRGWQRAIEQLRDADGDLRVTATPDGRFAWILADASGTVIAQSPPTHRDADSCRRAFALARRAARTVVGGTVPKTAPARSR